MPCRAGTCGRRGEGRRLGWEEPQAARNFWESVARLLGSQAEHLLEDLVLDRMAWLWWLCHADTGWEQPRESVTLVCIQRLRRQRGNSCWLSATLLLPSSSLRRDLRVHSHGGHFCLLSLSIALFLLLGRSLVPACPLTFDILGAVSVRLRPSAGAHFV